MGKPAPIEPIQNALTQMSDRGRVAAAHAPVEEPPGAREEPPTLAPPQSVYSADEADRVLEDMYEPLNEPVKNRTGTLRSPHRRKRDDKDTLKISFVLTAEVNERLRRVMLGFPPHLRRNEVVNRLLDGALRRVELDQQRRAMRSTG